MKYLILIAFSLLPLASNAATTRLHCESKYSGIESMDLIFDDTNGVSRLIAIEETLPDTRVLSVKVQPLSASPEAYALPDWGYNKRALVWLPENKTWAYHHWEMGHSASDEFSGEMALGFNTPTKCVP